MKIQQRGDEGERKKKWEGKRKKEEKPEREKRNKKRENIFLMREEREV